jgi:hypothetical protein
MLDGFSIINDTMPKGESKMSENSKPKEDPLGLVKLGQVIDEAADAPDGMKRVAAVYQAVMSSYTVLQDRYRLLKESNCLLAEEVAWLRDQCDDFAEERSELNDLLARQAPRERNQGRGGKRENRHNRRWEDRK